MPELIDLASLPVDIADLGNVKDSAPLLWQFQLPSHVQPDQLTINAGRLRKLYRTGAIAAGVVTSHNGELANTQGGIMGVNVHGAAVAGGRQTYEKPELSKSHLMDFLPGIMTNMIGKTALEHNLNGAAIRDNVADAVSQGATDLDAWAKQLDGALRESIRHGARQHLMQRMTPEWRLLMATAGLGGLVADAAFIVQPATVTLPSVFAYPFAQLLNTYYSMRIKKHDKLDVRPRWSIMPAGLEPDRYAAVSLISRMPGLIQVKK